MLWQYLPYCLDKKLLLAYYMFWVILFIDPVAPAPVLAFFAFRRLLSQAKSFVRNTYESYGMLHGFGANKFFRINTCTTLPEVLILIDLQKS